MTRPVLPVIKTNVQTLLRRAKWAYTTRHVPVDVPAGIDRRFEQTKSGDVILARIRTIGNHRRLQTRDARYSAFYPDDLVVATVGARYATDQFEGTSVLDADTTADLLAGGGVVGRLQSRNSRTKAPTSLHVLGRLTDRTGHVLNLSNFALKSQARSFPSRIIGVVGTAMNAGKTSAASWLIHGCERAGYPTAGIKLTGTGSFGDTASYRDAGASCVLDFTDAGMASTYMASLDQVRRGFDDLLRTAKATGCRVAIVELADGVTQVETGKLMNEESFASTFDGFILAAGDAMSATGACAWLAERQITPLAVTGTINRAPLDVREFSQNCRIPVFARETLGDPATVSALMTQMSSTQKARIA